MNESPMIPVYIPTLSSLLLHSERQKGSPLTEEEVLEIRDKGVCMMMEVGMAQALAERRGYEDLDPENVWEDWRKARLELVNSTQ